MIIDDLEFADIALFHHDGEKANDHLNMKEQNKLCMKCEQQSVLTFEHGRMMTCRLPRFSALFIVLRASANTFIRTIFV
jgi:hypothetical protein